MSTTARLGTALLAGALLFGTAGCCCGGGGHGSRHGRRGSPAPVQAVAPGAAAAGAPTLGRELEDLKAAYQRGAITTEEYEIARRRLVEQGGGAGPAGSR